MRYKPKRTRLPALFLALSILLSMLPPFVLAAETDTTSGTSQNSTYGQTTGNCTCGGSYVNGFCTDCDGYQEPSKDGDTYLIANAGNLYWFAAQVNNHNTSINAKLTKDIVVNKDLLESLTFDEDGNVTNGDSFRMWTPIVNYQHFPKYTGTFDGGKHTVSGLYYYNKNVRLVCLVGLFGRIGSGANIKNVGVVDNYFYVSQENDDNGNAFVGGVVGRADDGSTIIEGCYHTGRIVSSTTNYGTVGGILGTLGGSATVINCYNTGSVTGKVETISVGGVVGSVGTRSGNSIVRSCYNIGSVSGSGSKCGDIVGYISVDNGGSANFDYCFCLNTSENAAYNSNVNFFDGFLGARSEAEFASGEVAWLLNRRGDNGVWKQTLGEDKYPSFTGEDVAEGSSGYYNSSHIWKNGVCTNCGKKCTHSFGADGICTVCGVYCSCEPDENGVCTICKQPIAARITVGETISYRSNLNAAFAVARGKTATITLLCDTTLASTVEIDNSNTNITLIGGAYTVSAKCTMFKIAAGTLTVKSGTYAASSGKKLDTEDPFNETYITTSSNVFEVTGGTLNIESGTYTTTLGNVVEVSGSATDSTASSGGGSSSGDGLITLPGTTIATTTKGTVNIDGGSFTSKDGNALYVTSVSAKDTLLAGAVVQGTANITGGNFVGSSYAVYVDKASDAGTMFGGFGKLNVSGGTFGKLYVNGAPNEEVVLTGGSFDGVEVKMSIKPDVPACAAVLGTGYGFFDGNGNGIKLTDVSGDKACTVKLCTSHGWDSATGKCHYCATSCAEHIWDSATGECTKCGYAHVHESWTDGVCDDCGYHCPHGSWESATCTVCGVSCTEHVWNSATGKCSVCGTSCAHGEKNDNGCAICGYAYQVSVTVKNAMMIGDEGTTTYYFTLEDAIAAAVKISAKNNSLSSESIVASMKTVTVTLLSDLTLAGTIEIANSDADIILVGGEHTVTATDTIFRITGGSLTVQSGNFTTTGGNVFYVGGKVKIPESGIYIGATTETTTEGKLNISGGSFTSAGHTVYVTRVIESSESDETITVYTAKGRANISGGIFTSTDGYAVYDALDTDGGSVAGGDLSISGGSFNGGLYIGGLPAVKENTVTLSGGRFSRVSGFAVDSLGYYLPQYYAYFTADASGAYTIPTAAKSVGRNSVAVEIKLCTHIYTNADGKCDACGNESGFKFAGYTLTLDGTIGMNFYTRFSDEFASSNNALIRFTIGGETIEFKPSDAKDGTHEGESYKVFTVPVCAYEMNLDITAEALLDGKVVASDKTSVRAYAEYIIAPANGYGQEHIDFAVAMLNYGAASQVQADRETNDLANKDLSDAQKSVRSLKSEDLMEFKAENSTDATFGNFIGMNLVLYSETRLNVYFKLADGVDIDSVAFTVDGKTAEWEMTANGYKISISGIKAHDLDKNFTFAAKCGDETVTYTCSAMTYCYNVICREIYKTYTQNLRNLISAMRVYNQKSEIYGGNNAE